MFVVEEYRDMLVLKMSTDISLIERAVQKLDTFLEKLGIGAHAGARVVVRELLDNAIEHGNKGQADKEITLEVFHVGDQRLCVAVEDEGDGFDWTTIATHFPEDPQQERNRGYPLIKTVTDDFEFNEKGNRALAHITVTIESVIAVIREPEMVCLRPHCNLSVAICEKLRTILIDLLAENFTHFHFDLAHVKDIDSVAMTILVVFAKMCAAKNKPITLEVSGANTDVANLFKLTRLEETYHMLATI